MCKVCHPKRIAVVSEARSIVCIPRWHGVSMTCAAHCLHGSSSASFPCNLLQPGDLKFRCKLCHWAKRMETWRAHRLMLLLLWWYDGCAHHPARVRPIWTHFWLYPYPELFGPRPMPICQVLRSKACSIIVNLSLRLSFINRDLSWKWFKVKYMK